MAFKITDISKDLPRLNTEIQRLDLHQQQITALQTQVGQLQKTLLVDTVQGPTNHLSQNNIVFTWTGSTLTLSWAPAFIHSVGNYLHIATGHMVLAASTYYWMAWNSKHQTMSAQTSYQALLQANGANNLSILCQIFTGTAGQSGPAGGGGTEPGGVGNNGKQYKDF
jgi:hypothetical protein